MAPASEPPSLFLARLLGPTAVMLAITEPTNSHIWANSLPAVVYLNGTALFVGGLALVLKHNIWCRSWPVLVTALGWMSVGLGAYRMVAPERFLQYVQDGGPTWGASLGLGSIGIVLSCFGYLLR